MEAGRARVYNLPGNDSPPEQGGLYSLNNQVNIRRMSTEVDQNYSAISSYLDDMTRDKIRKGEFVDFERLLPRERSHVNENKMELIFKGGQTYFVPAADRELNGGITNFHRWEQAFRVYSNIYATAHPGRSVELIKYNEVNCTTSSAYTWENIYSYDKEFRHHMAHYPDRDWSIILQQAWTMILKDRLKHSDSPYFSRNESGSGGNGHVNKSNRDACKRFNKGQCTAGRSCRYDHRCLACGKFSHGAHICRKKKGDNNAVGGTAGSSQGSGK